MVTLRQAGWRKALAGETSLAEVFDHTLAHEPDASAERVSARPWTTSPAASPAAAARAAARAAAWPPTASRSADRSEPATKTRSPSTWTLGLFVVADGMGGHAAGEIASRLAVESILAFVARSDGTRTDLAVRDFDASLSLEANRLRTALHLANRRVIRAGASHRGLHTAWARRWSRRCLAASSVVVAHAGDSRVYEQCDGRLTQLTKDDSLVEMLEGR